MADTKGQVLAWYGVQRDCSHSGRPGRRRKPLFVSFPVVGPLFKNKFHLENDVSILRSKQTKGYYSRQRVMVRMAKAHKYRLAFYS